jgi:peroxiredoxin
MRSRPSTTALAALAALAVFTVWITWRAKTLETAFHGHDHTSLLKGKMAPAFNLTTLDGRKVSLSGYRGKHVAITFWASWCGPCRMELPVLRKFYEQTHKTGDKFEILAISIDTTREDAETAARQLRVPFPVLLDDAGVVAGRYGVESIPTMYVVGPDGKVAYGSVGFSPGAEIMLAVQLGVKDYNPAAAVKIQ